MSESNDRNKSAVRFARWVFLLAGIYGVLVVTPNYFLETKMGQDYPPAITHAEYFYGFAGVALAWQVAFLNIATDPARYWLIMLPSALEKFSFAGALYWLHFSRGLPAILLVFGTIDLLLGVLFLIAFARLGGGAQKGSTG
jgi:hypothetical protein